MVEEEMERFLFDEDRVFVSEYARAIVERAFDSIGFDDDIPDVRQRLIVPKQAFLQMCEHPTFSRYIFFVMLRIFPIVREKIIQLSYDAPHVQEFFEYARVLMVGIECSPFYTDTVMDQIEKIISALQTKWIFPEHELIPRHIVPTCKMLGAMFK
jgi:hypothetical protein